MSEVEYRPEIDGLRAVAILSVLFYHAHFKVVQGGFIGVDIFFVISGFLITSLILKDLDKGQFNIWDFWKRRFCRLLPAIAVMTAIVAILSGIIYFPDHYKSIGKQIVSQSVFVSNFYFYELSGYFNSKNELKPFLHTWSLAVEEQFYLVFPILFSFIYASWKRHIKSILIVLAVLSFAACIWMTTYDRDAAFYLLPFRAWELLLGGLLVVTPFRNENLPKFVSEIIGWAGLGLIAYGVFFYQPWVAFPGSFAALPCIGAVAFIWSNTNRLNSAGRLLSSRLLVFIGLISYSLYLWHWPLMAMTFYLPFDNGTVLAKSVLIVLSFLIGYLSWRYVETPFRLKGKDMPTRAVYRAAGITLACLGLIGSAVFIYAKTRPVGPGFLNLAAMENDKGSHLKECERYDEQRIDKDDVCQTNAGKNIPPDFIVWGDSHASAETALFFDLSEKYNKNGYVVFKYGCPPILNFFSKENKGKTDCRSFNNATLDFIERHHIKTVFLNSHIDDWVSKNDYFYFEPELPEDARVYKNDVMSGIQNTLNELKKRNVKIYVLLSPPAMKGEVPRLLALQERFQLGHEKAYKDETAYLAGRPDEMDRMIENNKDITFIDPAKTFCPERKCWAYRKDKALYYDTHHLSRYGVAALGPLYEPIFKHGFKKK